MDMREAVFFAVLILLIIVAALQMIVCMASVLSV